MMDKESMCTCLNDVCEMEKTVVSWLKMELAKGPDCADLQQFKELCDGVKDLAEAKKYIKESEYFCLVNKAMEESEMEPMDPRFGYNSRHFNNGKFAPTGQGHIIRGYDVHNRMPFDKAYLEDPEGFKETMRMYNTGGMYGYHDGRTDEAPWRPTSRNGEVYDKYAEAKRYYHEGDKSKKENMKEYANDWVSSMVGTANEMWTDAEPEQQTSMLKSMENLVAMMKATKK